MATASPCRLCGSTELHLLYSYTDFTVDTCPSCGFVQVDREPSPEELERLYGAEYFAHGKYELDSAAVREQVRRLDLLAACGVAPGARVLDVGCATGDFLLIGSQRFDMWGIDISADAVEISRERNADIPPEQIMAATLKQMPEKFADFDAVVLWDTVEHLWQPTEMIQALRRLVRPGGVIALSTPNIGAPFARLMRRRWPFMTPPEHLCFFSPATMRLLLHDNNLQTTRIKSRGKWVNLAFLFYKARRIFPIIPAGLINWLNQSAAGRLTLYVPTGDILYASARRVGD